MKPGSNLFAWLAKYEHSFGIFRATRSGKDGVAKQAMNLDLTPRRRCATM